MVKDFLFLIPLMPAEFLDSQRKKLRELCFSQIRKLDSSYSVWLLGDVTDESRLPEHFETIPTKGRTKEDKLFEAGKILAADPNPNYRYLIRLDDDDLINPRVFDLCAAAEFDCAVDSRHWFYDLSSGMLSRQKREWFPNTVIHAFESALTMVEAKGGAAVAGKQNFLFACDHSLAWHPFYENRNLKRIESGNPLYIRVLNPGSITATANGSKRKADYLSYLTTFGHWKAGFPRDFEAVKNDLLEVWKNECGEMRSYQFPKNTKLKSLIRKIRNR